MRIGEARLPGPGIEPEAFASDEDSGDFPGMGMGTFSDGCGLALADPIRPDECTAVPQFVSSVLFR